jgi:streptomycin 6-kinase
LKLPPDFIQTIENTYGEAGKQLISNLPALIKEVSTRWGVTDVQPVPNLSYNFVAFANRADDKVVLKIGVPNRELTGEMAALSLFHGEGACRLIDCDEEKGFLLLERLQPGEMLSTLQDDEEATHIAAELMLKIWRPIDHITLSPSTSLRINSAKSLDDTGKRLSPALAPGASVGRDERSLRVTYDKFIQLSDWFDGLKRLRAMFNGGTGPLNEKLVDRVEQSVRDFFAENHKPVLMHGDFHHSNLLLSERGWLVIDPKGVIGPAGYEVGPLLINPWGDLLSGIDYQRITKRRIDILCDRLGFERERIREWGLAHAILSAWWGIEDNTGWEYSMSFAELIADLPLDS